MLPAYTTNSLNELELLIYNVGVRQLVDRLRRHAIAGDTIDMMDMFQRLAFVSNFVYDFYFIFYCCSYS
jgi:hypothetical protein